MVRLYEEYLGEPNSEKAEKLLHTAYTDRKKPEINPGIAEIWEKVRLG